MFVEALSPPSASTIFKWGLSFVAYALVTGSLFILIASIFLIRPIKKLTRATRRIASGDFNVKLNIKQTGELGTLARSFEEMMHDLQQLEQMRREFVTNVSHEVQSPLTSISGYAIALKQANVADNDRNRYLDIIIAEAERMSKMSDSLLKLSLLESQSQQMRLTAFRLDEQIRRIIVAIQPQWSTRKIHFDLHLPTVIFSADHDLLNQVWTNIIGNSIKFSQDGGIIKVSIKQDIKNVIVRISDSGIGIALEDQKRIFERFLRQIAPTAVNMKAAVWDLPSLNRSYRFIKVTSEWKVSLAEERPSLSPCQSLLRQSNSIHNVLVDIARLFYAAAACANSLHVLPQHFFAVHIQFILPSRGVHLRRISFL